jgi:hypothetical protein
MEGVEVPALLIEDNGDIVLVLYDTELDRVLKVELVVVTMEGVGVPALLTEDIGDIVLVLYDTELDRVLKKGGRAGCCHHGMCRSSSSTSADRRQWRYYTFPVW